MQKSDLVHLAQLILVLVLRRMTLLLVLSISSPSIFFGQLNRIKVSCANLVRCQKNIFWAESSFDSTG